MATAEAMVTARAEREPGIWPGVPAADYHRWRGASNSRLSDLLRSPAHMREKIEHPREPTDDMALGTAAHACILEPNTFAALYTLAEACAGITGKGAPCTNAGKIQAEGAWWCGVHAKGKTPDADGRAVLAPEVWEQVARMAEAVHAHPAASALLALAGDREVSLVWEDPETGVRCKGRPDHLAGSSRIVVDLKTTTDASPESFTRSIFNFGYHRQAAHYIAGLAAHEAAVDHYAIIAVEKTPPFGVAVYRLMDDAVEAGRQQLRRLLALWRDCEERGEWPCYPDEITDISLPRWAWAQLEEEI